VDDPFNFPEVRVRQPGKLIPGRASYEIFRGKRELLGVATETESHRLHAIIKVVPGTRTLAVTSAAGEPMLTLVKRDSDWTAELIDPGGALVGRIRIGGSRRHYTLLDEQDQVAGKAVGDLAVKDFSVTGANGERYGRVRKTWAGPKELFTSADHYSVTFTGPVPPRTRTLIVMMAIVLDLAKYEPK
jgi:hypothetical protein